MSRPCVCQRASVRLAAGKLVVKSRLLWLHVSWLAVLCLTACFHCPHGERLHIVSTIVCVRPLKTILACYRLALDAIVETILKTIVGTIVPGLQTIVPSPRRRCHSSVSTKSTKWLHSVEP